MAGPRVAGTGPGTGAPLVPPARARASPRSDPVECDAGRGQLTIAECRPSWRNDTGTEWTRFPIARLRYTTAARQWSLYWRDRNLRFHRYDQLQLLCLVTGVVNEHEQRGARRRSVRPTVQGRPGPPATWMQVAVACGRIPANLQTASRWGDEEGRGERAPSRRSARLGGRLLAVRCCQLNEQSAAVDAAPLPRDLQAPGSVWLRRAVSDASASTVSAAARAWPVMTAPGGLGDGSGQPGPDPRRARSRALSRLSAMPWA